MITLGLVAKVALVCVVSGLALKIALDFILSK